MIILSFKLNHCYAAVATTLNKGEFWIIATWVFEYMMFQYVTRNKRKATAFEN